jgi:glycosyltransferase involved in cell wall biosynthesis
MYLIVTHIPIYVDGARAYVDDGWYPDLLLAREFFGPHFGCVHVAGPSRPLSAAAGRKVHEVGADTPGLRLHPSIDARTRARRFWLHARKQWLADIEPLLREALVVHSSVVDPFRPFTLLALLRAAQLDKPTVLVGPDMDPWATLAYQRAQMDSKDALMHYARTFAIDRMTIRCARRAQVTMLKEGAVYDRYAQHAANPKAFCHSMHRAAWVIGSDALDARLATLNEARPLRLVYCGRFVPYKGLVDSLRIVAQAENVTLDLIGAGEQREELEALVAELGLSDRVRFLGLFPYGAEFLSNLQRYDAVLYTPLQEDTARMVYDAFACGLPLLGTDIPFVKHRAQADGALVVWPVGDIAAGVNAVVQLDRDRDRLRALSQRARAAGLHHSVEHWYGLRAQWTMQIEQPVPVAPATA